MKKIFFLLLLLCYYPVQAQTDSSDIVFTKYNNLYAAKKIGKEKYFKIIDSIFLLYPTTNQLKQKLSIYQKIAWENNDTSEAKVMYWDHLFMNAQFTGREGSAIYYIDKMLKQMKLNNNSDTGLLMNYKIIISARSNNFTRCIEVYNSYLPYLNKLANDAALNKADSIKIFRGIQMNSIMSRVYAQINDTAGGKKTIEMAERLFQPFRKFHPNYELKKWTGFYDMLTMYKYQAAGIEDWEKAISILKQGYDSLCILPNDKDVWVRIYKADFLIQLTNAYIHAKKNKEADFYLHLLKNNVEYSLSQSYFIGYNEALLNANKGNYKEAYEGILHALKESDTMHNIRLTEMDKMMYSFTEAEVTRDELEHTNDKIKENRKTLLIIFSIIAAGILLSIYAVWRRNQRFKATIHRLNSDVDTQISLLEERTLEARLFEQKKLGRELHDDMANELAATIYQLDLKIQETKNDDEREALKPILENIKRAYDKARSKSHEWVQRSDVAAEQIFSKRITNMINNALPDSKYKKEIVIDENSVNKISTESRIEILRIIQESITNVLKHAKAQSFKLLIYEDEDKINLNIQDDGKGFNYLLIEQKKGIGLNSIAERVKAMDGEFTFNTNKNSGIELNISIPILY